MESQEPSLRYVLTLRGAIEWYRKLLELDHCGITGPMLYRFLNSPSTISSVASKAPLSNVIDFFGSWR